MIRIEEAAALSRFTTIGTGGAARWLARPETIEELVEVLAWAADHDAPVETVGLGSNLLVADEGFDGLIVKLAGELVSVEIDDGLLLAGGGATNAVCLHRARAAGLGGLEFASAIPGTAGGGVRMNAGAYGSDWRSILVDAVVAGPEETRTLGVDELDLSYRHSALEPGDVVARVRYRLTPKPSEAIKTEVAGLLAQRKATQPTNKRTFGSVFKNPDDGPGAGTLIERSGLKGHRIGGAVISERHANFIENAGVATSADAVALMAEARRRVYQGFGVRLEHEVRFLGALELPPL